MYIEIALKWDYEKYTVQISMPGYVCASLRSFQHKKPKRSQYLSYPWTQPIYGENNQMISEKSPAEELNENNQKRLQKIVGKLLYYTIAIDPPMLMAINSLAALQKKPTIKPQNKQLNF